MHLIALSSFWGELYGESLPIMTAQFFWQKCIEEGVFY
jgi:hypothetical protein